MIAASIIAIMLRTILRIALPPLFLRPPQFDNAFHKHADGDNQASQVCELGCHRSSSLHHRLLLPIIAARLVQNCTVHDHEPAEPDPPSAMIAA
jgi:hypothetical protein